MYPRGLGKTAYYLAGIVLLTAINFIGGKSVSLFAFVENDIALLWPPTGISLAYLLRFGSRWWPGIVLGNFLFHYSSGQPFFPAFATGLGDALSILVSLYFLRKHSFQHDFRQQKDVLIFGLFGLLLCPILGATFGSTARLISDVLSLQRYPIVWISWFIGDVTALMVLVPVLSAFPGMKYVLRQSASSVLETLALFAGIFGLSFLIFFNVAETKSIQASLVYLPLLFLVWAALRFDPFVTATAGLITSGMAVLGTAQGYGPFLENNIFTTIGFLWSYLIVASILALLLSVIHMENQRANVQLAESESRFRALSKASFEAIFVTEEGLITDFNDAALTLFGYSPEQFRSMPFTRLIDTHNEAHLHDYLVSQPAYPFETKALKKDGSTFSAELRHRVFEQEGKAVVVIAIQDISLLKESLEKEQALNEELALREEELKDQLNYVETMNSMLEKTNKALDRFVYSASHDLRAPISSALGLINIARLEEDRQVIAHYLNLQEKSLKKLDHFIADILDFSRNSRTEIQKEEIFFEDFIQEIFTGHEFAHNAGNIRKIVHLEQPYVFATDRLRLSIILNNLISNAIRYSNPFAAEPFVKICVVVGQQEATIQVTDNGLGIGPEHQHKVFDMFYRASSQQVGSGLGLYIVKEVLEKLKGTISLSSQVNEGTTFTLHIPNLHTPQATASAGNPPGLPV